MNQVSTDSRRIAVFLPRSLLRPSMVGPCAALVIVLIVGSSLATSFACQSPDTNQPSRVTASAGQVTNSASSASGVTQLSSPHPAHIEPYERTEVQARVSGYLEAFGMIQDANGVERPVDIGDQVVEGQILAIISVPELDQDVRHKQAMVEQAWAELEQARAAQSAAGAMVEAASAKVDEVDALAAQAEAEFEFRQAEHQRYAALVRDRAVRQELEDEKRNQLRAAEAAVQSVQASLGTARANLRVKEAEQIKAHADVARAEAHVIVAQSNLEMSQIMLGYATIKSPYAATVTQRFVDSGEFVQSAETGNPEPLFTLMRVDRLRVVSEIPEVDAARIQIGQTVHFQANAATIDERFQGQIVRCADVLDPSTRTMRVECELDDAATSLRPGMFGAITIDLTKPGPSSRSTNPDR